MSWCGVIAGGGGWRARSTTRATGSSRCRGACCAALRCGHDTLHITLTTPQLDPKNSHGLLALFVCVGQSPVPYFQALYFLVLLVHRAIRDDHMCREKVPHEGTNPMPPLLLRARLSHVASFPHISFSSPCLFTSRSVGSTVPTGTSTRRPCRTSLCPTSFKSDPLQRTRANKGRRGGGAE